MLGSEITNKVQDPVKTEETVELQKIRTVIVVQK